MKLVLPKICLAGLAAALVLPLAACGGNDTAATDKLAATEAAAKRAEDAAKRAEESAKAAKIAGAGSGFANEPAALDVPVAPAQDDDGGAPAPGSVPAQSGPGIVSDHAPQPPKVPV